MVDPRSILRYSWLEGNNGNGNGGGMAMGSSKSFSAAVSLGGSSMRRVKSMPAFNASARKTMGATSSMTEPMQFRAHLWKKAPGMKLFRYQWRYVVIKDARMYWWSTMEASEQEEPKGMIDFTDNMCEVFPEECDQSKFVLMPRMGRWKRGSFTGVNEGRVFRFDCRDSEFNRVSWLEALHLHLRYGEAKRRRGDAKAKLTLLLHPGADPLELEKALRDAITANVDRATVEFAAQQLRAKTGIDIETGAPRPSLSQAAPRASQSSRMFTRPATVKEGGFRCDARATSVDQFQRRLSLSESRLGEQSISLEERSDTVANYQEECKVEAVSEASTLPSQDASRRVYASEEMSMNTNPCMSSQSSELPTSDPAMLEGKGAVADSEGLVPTMPTADLLETSPTADLLETSPSADFLETSPSPCGSFKARDRSKSRDMSKSGQGDDPTEDLKHNVRRMTLHKEISDGPVWNELRAKLDKRRSKLTELDQHVKLEGDDDDDE